MSNALVRVWVHLVWATWDRMAWIDEPTERIVRDAAAAQCTRLDAPLQAFGSADDHVHAVVELNRQRTLVEVVRAIKGATSNAVQHDQPDRTFRWQEGYGAFSISEREPAVVLAYVREQRQRHAAGAINPEWEPEAFDARKG